MRVVSGSAPDGRVARGVPERCGPAERVAPSGPETRGWARAAGARSAGGTGAGTSKPTMPPPVTTVAAVTPTTAELAV